MARPRPSSGRSPARPAPAPAGGLRRRLRRQERLGPAQLAFTALGLLVVCSMLAAALGTTVVDELRSSDTGSGQDDLNREPSDAYARQLRATLAAHPQDAATMFTLANLLANENQTSLSEAIDWYEKGLAIDPSNTQARFDFAVALSRGGLRNDADLQFQKVLAAKPDFLEAHFYLAELYRTWDPPRLAEAAEHYRRVIELGPDTVLASQAAAQLRTMGLATPAVLASPAARPAATPGATR